MSKKCESICWWTQQGLQKYPNSDASLMWNLWRHQWKTTHLRKWISDSWWWFWEWSRLESQKIQVTGWKILSLKLLCLFVCGNVGLTHSCLPNLMQVRILRNFNMDHKGAGFWKNQGPTITQWKGKSSALDFAALSQVPVLNSKCIHQTSVQRKQRSKYENNSHITIFFPKLAIHEIISMEHRKSILHLPRQTRSFVRGKGRIYVMD